MKGPFFERAFHTLIEAFQNCLKRFPVTVCFVLTLTVYLFYVVSDKMNIDDKLLLVLGYYFSIGTLLSLSLHLWSEEIKSLTRKIVTHAVAHILLIADALFLYSLSSDTVHTEIGIAHGAGVLALILSIFFLSFTKEKNDIASWNFASYAIASSITAYLVGLIMSGGICLLAFSLQKLFDIHVDEKCYVYILIICSVLLPSLLFLGMLPKGAQKHNRQPQQLSFLNGVIRFLFLPLTAGYLMVLYIYAARILINWELPTGWVSWLVVTLMAGCIAIEFSLYPTRIKEAKRTDEWIARWLPALILPLLMLMTVGIIRRFNDYGITVNRLYLITLNIWFYIVCIGLMWTKARRISWIPISFAILFLLTSALPINYASITKKVLRSDIEKELKLSGKTKLPLSYEQYNTWLASLPKETAAEINDKFLYLNNWFSWNSISDLVEKDISFYNAKRHYGTTTDMDDKEIGSYISYKGQASFQEGIKIPQGYNQFTAIPNDKSDRSCMIPRQSIKAGVLPAYLGRLDKQTEDTVYIDLNTLKELDKYKFGEMPFTEFRCNSNNKLFMLTRFSIEYYENEKEDIELSISGYLFQK